MSAPIETIWPIEPHTEAKHRILREWWNGWLPKIALSPQNTRVIYFEGFAGPGIYSAGQPGSPIVALKEALSHTHRRRFEGKELIFYLVEERRDRAARLKQEIERFKPQISPAWKTYVIEGDFVDTMQRTLDGLETKGSRLAPTFAFLDPFGFGDLPMDLVARILSYRQCDVLITFDVRDINRFRDSPDHMDAINRCMGSTSYRNDLPDDPDDRRTHFLRYYEEEIRRRVPGGHVRSFEVSGMQGPIYYLVGATKHKEGVRVMKRAMWSEDRTGRYRFSDRTAGLTTLIEWFDEPGWNEKAARLAHERFGGQKATVEQVEDFVLFDTPYEFRRGIVTKLEELRMVKEIRAVGPRGGLNPGSVIVFR